MTCCCSIHYWLLECLFWIDNNYCMKKIGPALSSDLDVLFFQFLGVLDQCTAKCLYSASNIK